MAVTVGSSADIVLATLNARFAHASLGLRYLRANLGAWRERSVIREFVIGQKSEEIVERLLLGAPRIVALGVYIWNVAQTTQVVAMLKAVAPEVVVVVGGPEVSYESDQQRICALADYVVTGWGELTFAKLVAQILLGPRPLMKLHVGQQARLDDLILPYEEFTAHDLAHRHVYIEASRGCPFKCEFCLSSLDKTAWPFPLAAFLDALDALWRRGARRYKFVDRTFNLKIDASTAILDFFLHKIEADAADPPFLHFELIADHLPDKLRERIVRFPAGCLQFEIGIQTFTPEVQALISRRQNNDVACANLQWLRTHTQAHLHVDLIVGLPADNLERLAAGFDRLIALAPHEIQVGVLKRLRGAPIARHTQSHGLCFSPEPPYNVLATQDIDFATMQRLTRFARYWDLVGNSGRFGRTLPILLGQRPFAQFLALSDWLYEKTESSHGINNERLYALVFEFLTQVMGVDAEAARAALGADYAASPSRGRLDFVDTTALRAAQRRPQSTPAAATPARQRRHLRQPVSL